MFDEQSPDDFPECCSGQLFLDKRQHTSTFDTGFTRSISDRESHRMKRHGIHNGRAKTNALPLSGLTERTKRKHGVDPFTGSRLSAVLNIGELPLPISCHYRNTLLRHSPIRIFIYSTARLSPRRRTIKLDSSLVRLLVSVSACREIVQVMHR